MLVYRKEKDVGTLDEVLLVRDLFVDLMTSKLRSDFARRFTTLFDYQVMFGKTILSHEMLMRETYADAYTDFNEKKFVLYQDIVLHWLVRGGDEYFFISNISDPLLVDVLESRVNWSRVVVDGDELDLTNRAFQFKLFSVDLVDFSYNWYSYLPTVESRCENLAEHIILHKFLSEKDINLLEKIKTIKNIKKMDIYHRIIKEVERSIRDNNIKLNAVLKAKTP